jgi:hypothetical protein
MAEASSNLEMVQKIREHRPREITSVDRRTRVMEILEGAVLALVAIATSWCGYQATLWVGHSARSYAMASRVTMYEQQTVALASQDRLYDLLTFNGWAAARSSHNDLLANQYERRFRREYAVAFAAWRKLDPDHDLNAPPGPTFMPEYVNANSVEAKRLARQADENFEEGVRTREIGDDYVQVTVLLATVLLLTGISQHFRNLSPRVLVLAVASLLLVVSTYCLVTFPRA